jgi:hypothetical protein
MFLSGMAASELETRWEMSREMGIERRGGVARHHILVMSKFASTTRKGGAGDLSYPLVAAESCE